MTQSTPPAAPSTTVPTAIDPMLVELADSITGARTLEDLTRPLLEILEAVTGLESTYLTAIDEAAGIQRVLFARNAGQLQIPEGVTVPWADALCRRALEQGKPYTDDVGACWGDADAARELGIATFASTPVATADGALYGTLCAASTQRRPLPPNAGRVLELFARLIGLLVEREALLAQLHAANASLASQALMDALTGLPNRRALQQELSRMLARRQREGQRLLVAFIDLDSFKAINDSHGHEVGDQLLVAIGAGLAEGLRAGDLVARYGGDEFVVVAPAPPDAGPAAVRTLQELLTARTAVTVPLDAPDDETTELRYPGASVGVILTEVGELDADAVLARADEAMYAVKKAHRAAR